MRKKKQAKKKPKKGKKNFPLLVAAGLMGAIGTSSANSGFEGLKTEPKIAQQDDIDKYLEKIKSENNTEQAGESYIVFGS